MWTWLYGPFSAWNTIHMVLITFILSLLLLWLLLRLLCWFFFLYHPVDQHSFLILYTPFTWTPKALITIWKLMTLKSVSYLDGSPKSCIPAYLTEKIVFVVFIERSVLYMSFRLSWLIMLLIFTSKGKKKSQLPCECFFRSEISIDLKFIYEMHVFF